MISGVPCLGRSPWSCPPPLLQALSARAMRSREHQDRQAHAHADEGQGADPLQPGRGGGETGGAIHGHGLRDARHQWKGRGALSSVPLAQVEASRDQVDQHGHLELAHDGDGQAADMDAETARTRHRIGPGLPDDQAVQTEGTPIADQQETGASDLCAMPTNEITSILITFEPRL